MRIVVDTNRIIAALLKSGTTRQILFDESFYFLTPDFTLMEIKEHHDELRAKTRLNSTEFELLLTLLFERITIVPFSEYEHFLEQSALLLSDLDDAPCLALALGTKAAGIWSHDLHFQVQDKVKVFTNVDLFGLSERQEE